MLRRHPDLVLANLISLLTTFLILSFPGWQSPIRIVLGLAMVLAIPGYVLTTVLFPKKDDLDKVERLALSLGLSIAIVPLIGLILNYTPWGIRLAPISLSLSLFILGFSALLLMRRAAIPISEWSIPSITDPKVQLSTLIAFLVLAAFTGFLALSSKIRPQEHFSEFYILGPEGKLENYPSSLSSGASYRLTFGIANHEGEEKNYRIISTNPAAVVLETTLDNEESFEKTVALQAPETPGRIKIPFELYLDKQATPYRSLHLFVEITADETSP